MKKHNLTYLGGLAAVIALTGWTALHSEADFDNFAEADAGTQTVSVTCTTPTTSAYVPNVGYELTFSKSGSSAFSASGITATASLGLTAVNGDQAPTISKSNDAPATVTLLHRAPLTKIAGMQCQSGMHFAKLQARGVNNSADLDIAAEDVSANVWQNANQIDNADRVLFGGGAGVGLISGNNLDDGNDDDGSDNGEIVFGGSTAAGRHSLVSKVGFLGTTLPNASEVITYTFTPMANAQ